MRVSLWSWVSIVRQWLSGLGQKRVPHSSYTTAIRLETIEDRVAPGNVLGGLTDFAWANARHEPIQRVAALVGDWALVSQQSTLDQACLGEAVSRRERETIQLTADERPLRILPDTSHSSGSPSNQPISEPTRTLVTLSGSNGADLFSQTFSDSMLSGDDSFGATSSAGVARTSSSGEKGASGGGSSSVREEAPAAQPIPPKSVELIKNPDSHSPMLAMRSVDSADFLSPLVASDFQPATSQGATTNEPDVNAFFTFSDLALSAQTTLAYPSDNSAVNHIGLRETEDSFVDTNGIAYTTTSAFDYNFAITRSMSQQGEWAYSEIFSCEFDVQTKAEGATGAILHIWGKSEYTLNASGSDAHSEFSFTAKHVESTQELTTQKSTDAQDRFNVVNWTSTTTSDYTREISNYTDFPAGVSIGTDKGYGQTIATAVTSDSTYKMNFQLRHPGMLEGTIGASAEIVNKYEFLVDYSNDGGVVQTGQMKLTDTRSNQENFSGNDVYKAYDKNGTDLIRNSTFADGGEFSTFSHIQTIEILDQAGRWLVVSGSGEVNEYSQSATEIVDHQIYSHEIEDGQFKGVAIEGWLDETNQNSSEYKRNSKAEFDSATGKWITAGDLSLTVSATGDAKTYGTGSYSTASGSVWGTYGPESLRQTGIAQYFGEHGIVELNSSDKHSTNLIVNGKLDGDLWVGTYGSSVLTQDVTENLDYQGSEEYGYPIYNGWNPVWATGIKQTTRSETSDFSLTINDDLDLPTQNWISLGKIEQNVGGTQTFLNSGTGKYDYSWNESGVFGPASLEQYGWSALRRQGEATETNEESIEYNTEILSLREYEYPLRINGGKNDVVYSAPWEITSGSGITVSTSKSTQGYSGELGFNYSIQGGTVDGVQEEALSDYVQVDTEVIAELDAENLNWTASGNLVQVGGGSLTNHAEADGTYAYDWWKADTYGPPSLEVGGWKHSMRHGSAYDLRDEQADYLFTTKATLAAEGEWDFYSGDGTYTATGNAKVGYSGDTDFVYPIQGGSVDGTITESGQNQSGYSVESQSKLDELTNDWTSSGSLVDTTSGSSSSTTIGTGDFDYEWWSPEIYGPPSLEAYAWGFHQRSGTVDMKATESASYLYTQNSTQAEDGSWLLQNGSGGLQATGAIQNGFTGVTAYEHPIQQGTLAGQKDESILETDDYTISTQAELDLTTNQWNTQGDQSHTIHGLAITATSATGAYTRSGPDRTTTGVASESSTSVGNYWANTHTKLDKLGNWGELSGTYTSLSTAEGHQGFTGTSEFTVNGGTKIAYQLNNSPGVGKYAEDLDLYWDLLSTNQSAVDAEGKWQLTASKVEQSVNGTAHYNIEMDGASLAGIPGQSGNFWSYDASGETNFSGTDTRMLVSPGKWSTTAQSKTSSTGKGSVEYVQLDPENQFQLQYGWDYSLNETSTRNNDIITIDRSFDFDGDGTGEGGTLNDEQTFVNGNGVSGVTTSVNKVDYFVSLLDSDSWSEQITRTQQPDGSWLQTSHAELDSKHYTEVDYTASGTHSTDLTHKAWTYFWTEQSGGYYAAGGVEKSGTTASWSRDVAADGTATYTSNSKNEFSVDANGNFFDEWTNTTYTNDGEATEVDEGSNSGTTTTEHLPTGMSLDYANRLQKFEGIVGGSPQYLGNASGIQLGERFLMFGKEVSESTRSSGSVWDDANRTRKLAWEQPAGFASGFLNGFIPGLERWSTGFNAKGVAPGAAYQAGRNTGRLAGLAVMLANPASRSLQIARLFYVVGLGSFAGGSEIGAYLAGRSHWFYALLGVAQIATSSLAGTEICKLEGYGRNWIIAIHAGSNLLFAFASGNNAIHEFAHGDYYGGTISLVELLLTLQGATTACFSGDTPLLTEHGSKRIDMIQVGDKVLSRSEFDAQGELKYKEVQQVFVRTGRVLNVTLGDGVVVKTTSEHPFWSVKLAKWTDASELVTDDLLLSHDGQMVRVVGVEDTGEYAAVYNLRVADYHTYFVGGEEWGFSVWAHNVYTDPNTGQRATPERNRAIARNQQVRLERAGATPYEARALSRMGAEEHTNGNVLVELTANQLRAIFMRAHSEQARLNGVGDLIRRMAQQDCGLAWNNAQAVGEPEIITQNLIGQYYDVPLISSGELIRTFRSVDGQTYFCHGLSSGGKDSPLGRFSPLSEGHGGPYGGGMALLLVRSYRQISASEARPGDLIVWRDTEPQLPFDINHSAPLTHVSLQGNDFNAALTRLQSKDGPFDAEVNISLAELMQEYGVEIEIWRSNYN